MINFYCKCGQPMSVRPDYAGRQGSCPRCKQSFTVPLQSTTGTHAQQPLPPPPAEPTPMAEAPTYTSAAPLPMSPGAVPRGSSAHLEVVHGPPACQGKTFPLIAGRTTVLGRDAGADLTIPSERISRRHCRFEPQQDGGYVLEDLGSSNGTLVNQVRIAGRKVLLGGEYIQTGDCLFRFCE